MDQVRSSQAGMGDNEIFASASQHSYLGIVRRTYIYIYMYTFTCRPIWVDMLPPLHADRVCSARDKPERERESLAHMYIHTLSGATTLPICFNDVPLEYLAKLHVPHILAPSVGQDH
jgi:hypothetical protein